jgi:hypothetical protein
VSLLAGALLWQPLLAAEHISDVGHPSAGVGWYVDQAGFLVAMLLLVTGIAALDRAGVAGSGWVGRWALRGLLLAWALLVTAQIGQLTTGSDTASLVNALQGIGGLLTYPTGLVAGAAVASAGRLQGWRRWPLLAMAGYETVVILVPVLVTNSGPSWLAEAGWQVGWALVGAAAWSQARQDAVGPVTTPAEPPILSR